MVNTGRDFEMRQIYLTGVLAAAAFGASPAAAARLVEESGDAGELLTSAQYISGPFGAISGTLSNLDPVVGIDDIDLFRFYVPDPRALSVSTFAELSEDNDAQLFLFDEMGRFLVGDDDSGADLLPQLALGSLSGRTPGYYYLAFNLYDTRAILQSDVLIGWSRNPTPLQTGAYVLTVTGVGDQAGAVPEPSTWAMTLLGLGLVAGAMRSKRRTTITVAYT